MITYRKKDDIIKAEKDGFDITIKEVEHGFNIKIEKFGILHYENIAIDFETVKKEVQSFIDDKIKEELAARNYDLPF